MALYLLNLLILDFSGRFDRKIEFPNPNEEARARILQIHSRKMNVRYSKTMFHVVTV